VKAVVLRRMRVGVKIAMKLPPVKEISDRSFIDCVGLLGLF
jgi:hypothetical protein